MHIVKFYQKLFTEQCWRRPLVDGISFDSILESKASWLERAFEEEDVRKVVSTMVGDKASGPNDFSMAFFQECWVVLRGGIMEVHRDFHDGGFFLKEPQCFVHFAYSENFRCYCYQRFSAY